MFELIQITLAIFLIVFFAIMGKKLLGILSDHNAIIKTITIGLVNIERQLAKLNDEIIVVQGDD